MFGFRITPRFGRPLLTAKVKVLITIHFFHFYPSASPYWTNPLPSFEALRGDKKFEFKDWEAFNTR